MAKWGVEAFFDGEKEPEVAYQVKRLVAAVELASSRMDTLAERLSPVLGPAYPMPSCVEAKHAAPNDCSPLASNLRGIVERVERIEALVNQTIGRLEVG